MFDWRSLFNGEKSTFNDGLTDISVPALRPTTGDFFREAKSLRDIKPSCSRDRYFESKSRCEFHYTVNIGVMPLILTQSIEEGERILTPLVSKEHWHPNLITTTSIYDHIIKLLVTSKEIPNGSRFLLYTPRVKVAQDNQTATSILTNSFNQTYSESDTSKHLYLSVYETGHFIDVDR